MPFNFEAWKQGVFDTANKMIDCLDLLVASGTIEFETLEEAFEKMLDQIAVDQTRRAADGDQHG